MGGVEKSLMQFLKFLVEEKHEVDLYLWTLPGILFGEIPPEVKILSPGKFPQSIKECSLKNFIPFLLYRISTLRTGSYKLWSNAIGRLLPDTYDIAISFSDNDYSRYCVIDNVDAHKKIQFYHHGCYSGDEKTAAQDAKYFSAYDNLVTVSETNLDMLNKRFPALKGRIRVINNLIDISKIRRLAKEIPAELSDDLARHKDVLKLCTIGRLSRDKGTDLAFAVAQDLRKRGIDFRWYFVGEEAEKGMVDLFRTDKEIYERCVFTGVCKNPYAYLDACDIYVHPSRIEAECLVLKEAVLLKKRMVVSDIPSISEIVKGLSSCSICRLTVESMIDGLMEQSGQLSIPVQNDDRIESRNLETFRRLRDLLSE